MLRRSPTLSSMPWTRASAPAIIKITRKEFVHKNDKMNQILCFNRSDLG